MSRITSSINLFNQLLIFLEDSQSATLGEIRQAIAKRASVVRSAIERLINSGYVKKVREVYSLTRAGDRHLFQTVESLKKFDRRPAEIKFQLILFQIPEKQKSTREKFRNYFKTRGFGQLQRGVLISYGENRSLISEAIDELAAESLVMTLEFSAHQIDLGQLKTALARAWNFSRLNNRYRQFINQSDNQLKGLKKLTADKRRLMAKQLVFDLATIVQQDPVLPESLWPVNQEYLGLKAFKLYEQLKPFCNE